MDVTQPGLFEAILRVQNTTVDVELSLYDSTYQRKSWGAAGVGDPVHLISPNLSPGCYYLLVRHYNWSGTPTLQLRPQLLFPIRHRYLPADRRYYLRT